MNEGEMVTIKAERNALARHIEELTQKIGDHDAILVALAGFLARRQSAGQFAAFS